MKKCNKENLEELKKDFDYLKKVDPYFNFKDVEEWAEFLDEMENN